MMTKPQRPPRPSTAATVRPEPVPLPAVRQGGALALTPTRKVAELTNAIRALHCEQRDADERSRLGEPNSPELIERLAAQRRALRPRFEALDRLASKEQIAAQVAPLI